MGSTPAVVKELQLNPCVGEIMRRTKGSIGHPAKSSMQHCLGGLQSISVSALS